MPYVHFTCFRLYSLRHYGLKAQRRKGKMRMAAEGALQLLQVHFLLIVSKTKDLTLFVFLGL